ncbi:MAG TPA: hypothetical protein VLB81_16475 [Gaiellales bacterium]|nr:hypothetical protein [Gaiellales bacterium]
MSDGRVVAGAGGSAVGVAVDPRTAPATVSVWIEMPGSPIQGANLSPEAARELAERLTRAAGDAA